MIKPASKAFLLFVSIVVSPSLALAKTIRLDSTQSYRKAGTVAVVAGDTICIAAGRRSFQYLQGITGTAEQPIVITNCPEGRLSIGPGDRYGLWLDSVAHVRITGGLDPSVEYGIHIDSTILGSGLGVTGNSHHVEIDHIEISGTHFAGIMAKQDYGESPPEPWPVFTGLHIHHNRIHHTGGEGMYLGETKSPGQYFREVSIHHNLVAHTGWDLMQVANMDGVDIAHNVMIDGGVLREPVQQNGFQIGDNTRNLRFHHNVVMDVGANAAIVMGSGNIVLDSNWFSGARIDQALFIDNRTFVDTATPIVVRDNFWQSDSVPRMWSVYNEHNTVLLEGNHLAPDTNLIRYASGAGPANVTLRDNSFAQLVPLAFADTAKGDYRLVHGSPYAAWNFGFGAAEANSIRRGSRPSPESTSLGVFGFSSWGLPVEIPHPQGRRGR
ncbi:MAG TPA: right-handed parallel beta-helix repeat-containing protein [Fibrobacteria bacterium]|nr:right-handed parallel beta-helix repeat-containing protein [Fibrobacteria bacterium]HOX51060.1 right-handed parallel beta-helix repeat-containing protein [Fibrobacteria bacterium]